MEKVGRLSVWSPSGKDEGGDTVLERSCISVRYCCDTDRGGDESMMEVMVRCTCLGGNVPVDEDRRLGLGRSAEADCVPNGFLNVAVGAVNGSLGIDSSGIRK